MNFEGNLSSLFLPNLLQMVNKEGTNGVITISHPRRNLSIFIENGEVVYADGIDKEEQLLNLMSRRGIVSGSLLAQLRELKKENPFAFGPGLLGKKLISVAAWQRFLKLKVEQVMLQAFLNEDADFKFSTDTYSLPPEYKAKINLMQIILDITRKIDEWNFVKNHIPDRNIVFQTCEDPTADKKSINFNRSEWAVLSKIDGKRSVEEIINQCDMEELQVLKILYTFLSSGLIKRLDNVYLNWRGNFVDYEGIVSLYIDLFKILEKNLQLEIGQEFYRLLDKCLNEQTEKGNTLLSEFKPFAANGHNDKIAQGIIKKLARYVSFNEGKRELLLSFSELIQGMVERIRLIVGPKLIDKTLNEIYATISFVGKYQQQTSDINALVLDSLKTSLEGSE